MLSTYKVAEGRANIQMWLHVIIISRKKTSKNNTKLQLNSTWIVSPWGCFRAPLSGTSTTWKKVAAFEVKREVRDDFCFSFFFFEVGSQVSLIKDKNTVDDNQTWTRKIQEEYEVF